MEKWPNLFIVGVPRGGTTSIYEYLKNIPEIYVPSTKEPHYFSVNINPAIFKPKPIRIKTKYLELFASAKNEKFIADCSTSYIYDPDAAKQIYSKVPEAKIVISLRDPVERIFSHYLLDKRLGWLKSSFHDELKSSLEFFSKGEKSYMGLQIFKYSENVLKFLETFGKDQVKVIIFEKFVENPKKTIEEILQFLGLDSSINDIEYSAHNKSYGLRGPIAEIILQSDSVKKFLKIIPQESRKFFRKKFLTQEYTKSKMNEEDKHTLIDFYKDDVLKLQNILHHQFPWKNFSD